MKKKRQTIDMLRVFLGLAVATMVITGAVVWAWSSHVPVVAMVLVLVAIYVIWRKKASLDSGMPMDDELSKRVVTKAGYCAYFVSMYTALGVSMFEDQIASAAGLTVLGAADVAGIVILVSALMFFACIFYFQRKGVPDEE